MDCPKCGLVQGDAPRCARCGARMRPPGADDASGRADAGLLASAGPERVLPPAGFRSVGLPDRQKATLFHQIARLLRAGIPPVTALETTGGSVSGRRMRAVCVALVADLNAGKTLGDAMSRLPRDFDPHELGTVRAAELIGAVPDGLERLHARLERSRARKRQVLGGLLYPLVVLTLSFFLLPLPHLFFGRVGAYLAEALVPLAVTLALAAGAVFGWGRLRRHPRYWPPLRAAAARIPIVRSLLLRSGRRTFSAHLGRALDAGLPIDRALRSAGEATGDPRFRRLADDAVRHVLDDGRSLTDAFRTSAVFPDEALLIVAGGERSGDLAASLEMIAQHEDEDLDQRAHVVTRLATIGLSLVLLGYVGLRVFSGMTGALMAGQDQLMKELPPGLFQDIPKGPGDLQRLFDQADDALRGPGIRPMPH